MVIAIAPEVPPTNPRCTASLITWFVGFVPSLSMFESCYDTRQIEILHHFSNFVVFAPEWEMNVLILISCKKCAAGCRHVIWLSTKGGRLSTNKESLEKKAVGLTLTKSKVPSKMIWIMAPVSWASYKNSITEIISLLWEIEFENCDLEFHVKRH